MAYLGLWFKIIVWFLLVISSCSEGETDNPQPSSTAAVSERADSIAAYELDQFSNWEQLLVSTPHTVVLLGHLMLITTENDFSLDENAPKEGFQYLKYPSSFRASLVQMTNMGWDAFNEAHKNMDSIRLLTQNINKHVKLILNVITTGTIEEVELLVPMTLKKIQRIADECLDLSIGVEDRFLVFMKATAELLEASTNAKGVYEEKNKETESAIKAAKEEEKAAKEEKEILEKRYEEIKVEIRNAQEDFKEALKDMPSSGKIFGLSVLDTFWGVIKIVIPGNGSPMYEQFQTATETDSTEDRVRQNAYMFAEDIHKNIQTLVEVATSGKEKGNKTPNWNEIDSVRGAKCGLVIIVKNLKREPFPTDVHRQAIQICNDAINACEQLDKMHRDISPKQEGIEDFIIQAEDILLDAEEFVSAAEAFVYSNGPRMSLKTSMFSSSLVENEHIKSQIKVDTAKDILKGSRRKQEEVFQNIKRNNERMTETLKDMVKFNIQKVDFDEIRKILIQGLRAIQDVRKQWGELVRLFQMISRVLKMRFHDNIINFIEHAEVGAKLKLKTNEITQITRNLLSEEAFNLNKMAYAVHTISSTYVEISDKYLIDEINSLSGLAALDTETDKEEIEEKRLRLNEYCKNAQDDILQIIIKRRQECSAKVQKGIEEINNDRS